MSKGRKVNVKLIKGKNTASELNSKSTRSTTIEDDKNENLSGESGVIMPPYPIKELQNNVEKCTILEQCVEAYRRNIVGNGAIPEYIEHSTVYEETLEMRDEWETVEEIIKHFNYNQTFEDVFGNAIEDT